MNMNKEINSNTILQISKQKSKHAEKFLPSSNNKTTITLASKVAD